MYRIFTEDKDRRKVTRDVAKRFKGFTIIPSIGFWKGKRERSLDIELATNDRQSVLDVARAIKRDNRQEAVLVQRITGTSKLV